MGGDTTIAMEGHPERFFLRVEANARAFSKRWRYFRRDSALYQAAPRRDLPRSLGMLTDLDCLGVGQSNGGRAVEARFWLCVFLSILAWGRRDFATRMIAAE